MLTVRPLTKDGKWQNKTEKEYLCVRNGEERGFTASEFKVAQAEGWEKQYQYKVGKRKIYMTPSAAEARGLERISKYPKSTKYGRQNSLTARWNSENQLVFWRAAWAEAVNHCLERTGRDERVDHRSHAERGLDERPTIHEGADARAMERKGIASDRCELNRQIRADNAVIRTLKATIAKLKKALENTIPAIAAAMETIRQNMIVFNYGLLFVRDRRKDTKKYVEQATRKYIVYKDTHRLIKAKDEDRDKLQKELADLPVFAIGRRKELNTKIAELSEEIEELRIEEKSILQAFDKADDAEMEKVEGEISKSEARIVKLDAQEVKFTDAISCEKEKFDRLKAQATDLDQDKLTDARLALRPQMEREAQARIRRAEDGRKISFWDLHSSVSDADKLLGEDGMAERREEGKRLRRMEERQRQKHETKAHQQER